MKISKFSFLLSRFWQKIKLKSSRNIGYSRSFVIQNLTILYVFPKYDSVKFQKHNLVEIKSLRMKNPNFESYWIL